MRVYIVRHGKATDRSEQIAPPAPVPSTPMTDFDRELTARGEAQAAFLAERLVGVDLLPEVILCSRYPRAIQTARAISGILHCALVTEFGLEVDHDVSEAIDLIDREHEVGHKCIMIVGHNPQLGELLGVLASGLPPQEMILKTGELVALEVRPSQMVGSAKIVGRLRLSAEKNDETIVGGLFAIDAGGKLRISTN
jgi:phosphohistidine phosphatase